MCTRQSGRRERELQEKPSPPLQRPLAVKGAGFLSSVLHLFLQVQGNRCFISFFAVKQPWSFLKGFWWLSLGCGSAMFRRPHVLGMRAVGTCICQARYVSITLLKIYFVHCQLNYSTVYSKAGGLLSHYCSFVLTSRKWEGGGKGDGCLYFVCSVASLSYCSLSNHCGQASACILFCLHY